MAAAPVSMVHAERISMGMSWPADISKLASFRLSNLPCLFSVTAVTANLDGWGRTATWIETIVCQVLARMLAHALTN